MNEMTQCENFIQKELQICWNATTLKFYFEKEMVPCGLRIINSNHNLLTVVYQRVKLHSIRLLDRMTGGKKTCLGVSRTHFTIK